MIRRAKLSCVVVGVLGILALHVPALAMEGSGTEADPYIILNVFELQAMQNNVGAVYVLGDDIDASDTRTWNGGAGFEPIRHATGPFTGTFDGRGHTITGLYIDRPSASVVGLFGRVSGAEIANVGLIDVEVYGDYATGSLVGSSQGLSTVTCCYATGNVTISASESSDTKSGGLVGANANSLISQCYSAVNVTALGSRYQLGGLCGYSRARSGDPPALIVNCYSAGTVTSNGWKVGGLLGDADGRNSTVSKCYSVGQVNGTYKKGLVGYNFRSPTIKDSYWDKQATTCASSYGGKPKTTAEMMQQATFVNWEFIDVWDIVEDESYPFLQCFVPPLEVVVDIRPGSCRNPVNMNSHGVLPVAVLGSGELDVKSIDVASVRLAGVAPVRSSYEDVAAPASDRNESECTTPGPDGYIDLILRFKTQQIGQQLVNSQGEPVAGQQWVLILTGVLSDQTAIEGADCILVVGKVPKSMAAKSSDINSDGIVNILDFGTLVKYWLESTNN